MSELLFAALIGGGLAVLLAVLVPLYRTRGAGSEYFESWTRPEPIATKNDDADTLVRSIKEQREALNELDRMDSTTRRAVKQEADVLSETRPRRVFEYTIKRSTGIVWKRAVNLGGFTEVPILLYDRMGNSFTIHRRVCLN